MESVGRPNSLKTRYAMGADRPWPTMKRVVARAERCGIRKPHYRACGDAWHISSRKTAKEQLNACPCCRRRRQRKNRKRWHAFNCSDRKSTRLNSSHANISYAVFCLKKKKKKKAVVHTT